MICKDCNGYGTADGKPAGTLERDFGPGAVGSCRHCGGQGAVISTRATQDALVAKVVNIGREHEAVMQITATRMVIDGGSLEMLHRLRVECGVQFDPHRSGTGRHVAYWREEGPFSPDATGDLWIVLRAVGRMTGAEAVREYNRLRAGGAL